jgi:hypothetical protein
MSACPQCGTVAKPTDKFCNVCGTPIPAGAPAGAAPPAYGGQPPAFGAPPPGGGFGAPPPGGAFGAPPPQQGAFGAPPPQQGFGAPGPGGAPGPRCQMGHDIAPGASYCAQGHPIALDQMQFANDAYGGAPGGQFGAPPQAFGAPPQGAYGAPPPPQGGFGAPPPQQGFGAPPQQQGFGAPPQGPQGYAPPPAQGFGAPPPQPGYAPPPAGPGGFGAPPGAAPGFGPPGQPGFGGAPETPAKIVRGFLVAYGANPAGDFWPLTGGRITVGRLAQADGIDISLQDPTISSRHAAFNVDATTGGVAVEDTGSTNGTFVNDEHIGFNGRRELRDGDRVRFGGFSTIVKVIGRV